MNYYNYLPTRNFQIYQIFASNTNLGKTIISTGLIRSSILKSNSSNNKNNNNDNNNYYKNYKTYYLKSIQTGYPKDSDSRFVKTYIPEIFNNNNNNNNNDFFVKIKTLYKYEKPVSPHLATDNPIPNDDVVLNKVKGYISDCYNESINSGGRLFLETAGGVVYI